MRPQQKIRSTYTATDAAVVTTTELAVATLNGVSNQSADGVIRLTGLVNISTGASTTAVVVRVRRGSGITGTVVGEAQSVNVAAATNYSIPIQVEDTPGEVGGVPYTLTVQQTGAAANGNALNATLTAIS